MGSVWCAQDGVLERRVAIKLLGEALLGDPTAVRRFMREARAAARLSEHANVVTIFDVGTHAGRPYIVMEHLAGGTVANATALEAYSHPEALRWIAQAGAALDYAHGRGVVHRDVKPANMLLGTDRMLHLADFGIASLGTEQTLSGTGDLFGTAAYLAPEQAVGHSATAATDRYALAVVAFELITGGRPFQGDSFAAQARAHIEDPPPRASDRAEGLSRSVDAVLRRGMAKAPQERWPTAQSFADALAGALNGEPARGLHALPRPSFAVPRPSFAVRRPSFAVRLPSAGTRVRAAVRPRPTDDGHTGDRHAGEPPLVIFDSVASAGARRFRAPAAAVLTLALVALIAGVLVGTSSGGSSPARARLGASAVKLPATTHRSKPIRTPVTRTRPQYSATLAANLEAHGHTLMLDGAYTQALPVLRHAVAMAPPSTVTYAYALFDLGRTLQLSGDPTAAIPILEQRLQIPNQPAVVEQELLVAKAAAAAQDSGQGAATTTTPGATTTTQAPNTPSTTGTATSATTTTSSATGGAALGTGHDRGAPGHDRRVGVRPGHGNGSRGTGHQRRQRSAAPSTSDWLFTYLD
jgi:hypothetical protein